jgi:predicted phosphodiesterase
VLRFLCVSDIHGELDALRAVLATAEKRSFQKLLVAGDIVFPGPEPLETWRRLSAAGAIMVQGVSDRALATLNPDDLTPQTEHEKSRLARMREVQTQLGELVLGRLRRTPTHVRMPLEDGRELLLVHGSPMDASEPLTHDMSDEELLALIGDDPADVIVCGMSHVPFDRTVADIRIINVGSVGDAPDGASEGSLQSSDSSTASTAGSPVRTIAHATWIESTPAGISVEQIVVPLGATEGGPVRAVG